MQKANKNLVEGQSATMVRNNGTSAIHSFQKNKNTVVSVSVFKSKNSPSNKSSSQLTAQLTVKYMHENIFETTAIIALSVFADEIVVRQRLSASNVIPMKTQGNVVNNMRDGHRSCSGQESTSSTYSLMVFSSMCVSVCICMAVFVRSR